jgi:hypothetical protein
MKSLLPAISLLGLALVIAPPLVYLIGGSDVLTKSTMTTLMLIGTIAWFVTAPLWMRPPGQEQEG